MNGPAQTAEPAFVLDCLSSLPCSSLWHEDKTLVHCVCSGGGFRTPENNSVAWIMPGRLLTSQNRLPVSVALGGECWVKLLVSLPNNPS